jgi:hypothetical protein
VLWFRGAARLLERRLMTHFVGLQSSPGVLAGPAKIRAAASGYPPLGFGRDVLQL